MNWIDSTAKFIKELLKPKTINEIIAKELREAVIKKLEAESAVEYAASIVTYNVERIDFGKGSNSLIFGDVEPGGQASVFTKRAIMKNFGTLLSQYTSDGAYRFQLDYNRKLARNLAVRFNAVRRQERTYQDASTFALEGETITTTWQPLKQTMVRIEYERGDIVALNGKRMSPAAVLTELNRLGGKHGIGRLDLVENRYVGMKSRGCYETPGGTIMLRAHRAIESITLDREVAHLKDDLMPRYASMIYNGYWWSPERRAIQDWVVRPLLRSIPGVAEINSQGGYVKQYQALVNPDRMNYYGLKLNDIYTALARNNANSGGGILPHYAEQYLIRGVGLIQNLNDIGNIVLKDNLLICTFSNKKNNPRIKT